MNITRHKTKERGAALLFALGMLGIFAALGTAYVTYMALEQQRSYDYVSEVRARQLAERGIWATVGDIQTALAKGEMPVVGIREEELFPVYRGVSNNVPEEWQRRDGRVVVSVEDESAKLNINHAPTRVLQAMLGIDGRKARAIRRRLPRPGEAPTKNQSWFTSVDGLVARGFLTREALNELEPQSLLTAHSVADNRNPQGFINVNTAPKEVLAAVFDAEVAERIVTARAQEPVEDFAGLLEATEADPATFNLSVPADGTAPPEIAFESRSFRIVCEAKARKAGDVRAGCRVEAVVVLSDTGNAEITYWRETSLALDDGEETAELVSNTQQQVAES
ncbi:MAG: type II secretion system protein GspK [Candidatus Hydrogenedentota bacterium]